MVKTDFRSIVYLTLVDCNMLKQKFITLNKYEGRMMSGKFLGSEKGSDDWKFQSPNSSGEVVLINLCKSN